MKKNSQQQKPQLQLTTTITTTRYRVIQKRLLMRYKDRSNPAPLGNLDALLQLTYESISTSAETIEEAEKALIVVSQHLRACTRLVLLLIQYRFDLSEDVEVLKSYFGFVEDHPGQGWEEICEYNLEHMLKCALTETKSGQTMGNKDGAFLGNSGNPLKPPQDLNKLKKRITTVIDRLANGVRMSPAILGEEEDD